LLSNEKSELQDFVLLESTFIPQAGFESRTARRVWYVTNHTLHKDLRIPQVQTVLQELTDTHRTAMHSHPNTLMAQILAPPNSRRLQRRWTLDV